MIFQITEHLIWYSWAGFRVKYVNQHNYNIVGNLGDALSLFKTILLEKKE